ncbi:hypothetical protein NKH14_31560 [Mesorhizobium sp. M1380]
MDERGIKDRIAYKAKRGKKQPNWQKWMNKVAANVRAGIERTNATMKNWYRRPKDAPYNRNRSCRACG